jgi:protein involved in polysaccharide export with SLBB domain
MLPLHESRSGASERPFAPAWRKASPRSVNRLRAILPVFGVVLLFAAAGVGYAYLSRPASASLKLFAYEKTFATQAEAADFVATTTSTGSLARLAAKLPGKMNPIELQERIRVVVDHGQPHIGVMVTAEDESTARPLAEAVAKHVSNSAEDWVSRRTKEVDRQISAAQRRLRDLRTQFGEFDEALLMGDVKSLRQTLVKEASKRAAAVSSVESQLAAVNAEERKTVALLANDRPALRSLQQELEQALTRYTDEHPRVKELRASLVQLQKESRADSSKGSSRTNAQLAELGSRRNSLREQLKKAEASEIKSRTALQKFATNEVEFVRLQSEHNALSSRRDDLIQSRVLVGSKGVEKWRRADRVEVARTIVGSRMPRHGAAGALAGLCVGSVFYSISRRRGRVIRNAEALEISTGLPVLSVLPPLEGMTETARNYWAIEALNLLRNTAKTDRRGCFVCGIISSVNGEGRSTWIELLADAGLRNGNRVLIISRPDSVSGVASELPPNTVFTQEMPGASSHTGNIARYALVADVANVSLQKHWERAFAAWQQEENAIVLVELPPATTADALLLCSAVPNVLWLGAANVAEAETTRTCVNSLRNTGCRFIGAALNMSSATSLRTGTWTALLAASLLVAPSAWAQVNTPAATNAIAAKGPMLAPWQQKLTLGPGDVFDISLYGQPDSARQGVTIGPDGRFSYLQALDVQAAGQTVDELRGNLETVLMKFHLAPRVVIVPTAFNSKKYFMLGNVTTRGAFVLDKPTTIVEAVARAKGFVHGEEQRSNFNLADLAHAFLVRRQPDGSFARESIDFEGLFNRGELQHNQLLAPEDYIYFPPMGLEQVYVLGEVGGPSASPISGGSSSTTTAGSAGVVPYTKNLTVLGAIAGKGGFTDAAFREKILVIRGSLERPETFVVDVGDTLRAAAPDFVLQPRDIIYVSRKPWAKAEELLKSASSDFVRAAVTAWTGREVGTIIK